LRHSAFILFHCTSCVDFKRDFLLGVAQNGLVQVEREFFCQL